MAIKDDYAANTSTKGKLAIPTNSSASLVGTIETKGDHDWFKVSLIAGKAYHFGVYSITEKTFLSTYAIHNSAGIKLDTKDGVFIANKSDDYYINVSGDIGKYKVFATQYYDDYTNNISTTGEVVNNKIIGNSDYYGDIDWFKINMVAGRTYYFNNEYHLSSFDSLPPNRDQSIKLYDSFGKLVNLQTIPDIYGSSDGNSSIGILTPSKSSNYFLGVSYDIEDINQNYSIEIHSFIDDFGNTIAKANSIASPIADSPVVITGKNEAFFDKDFFAINLKAGLTYKFSDTSSNQKSPHYLDLYNAAGKVIQSNTAENNTILFKATESSKFYLNVSERQDSNSNYSVTVTEVKSSQLNSIVNNIPTNGNNTSDEPIDKINNTATIPVDDYGDNLSTNGNFIIPDIGTVSITGNIEKKDDHDWVRVHLSAGETYQFNASSIKEQNFYAGFILRDSTGKAVDSVSKEQAEFFINTSDDYYLDVSTYKQSNTNGDTGTYEITANKVFFANDDYEGNIFTTGHLINNLAIGNIDYNGDSDWFKADLQAGQTYFFDAGFVSISNHSNYEWAVNLQDPNKNGLTFDNQYYDYYGIALVTPKKSGSYYFSVKLNFSGDPIDMPNTHYKYGLYKLTDDFGNDIKSAYNYSTTNLDNPLVIEGKHETVFDKDFFQSL